MTSRLRVEHTKACSTQPRSKFFVVWAGVLLAIVLVGFSPSFFLEFLFEDPGQLVQVAKLSGGGEADAVGAPGLPLHVIAHGVLATAWVVLFFVQSLLISKGGRRLHRKLGVVGGLVAAGVAVSGVTAVFLALPRLVAFAHPPDPAAFIAEHLPGFAGDIGSLIAFAVLVGAAVYFRRKPDTHKRLMLVATLILIPPAIFRIWVLSGVDNAMELWFPLTENGLAVSILASDWLVRRRAPWPLIGAFVFWVVVYGVMTALGSTDAAQTWALGMAYA